MQYVNPILGRAGLCNKLFVWARAEKLRRELGADMFAPQWVDVFKIGPWLRFERDKRYYVNSFSNAGYVGWLTKGMCTLQLRHIPEGEFAGQDNCIIDVTGMKDFFIPFLDCQEYIARRLNEIVVPRIVESVQEVHKQSFIGVHIRRGDFVKIGAAVSDEWYIKAIGRALDMVGDSSFPIRIFSDGTPVSLSEILNAYPNAQLQPKAPAIQDVLMLARGRVNVCTSGSSFSMWAVFLGQMPSIWNMKETPQRMYVGENKAIQI